MRITQEDYKGDTAMRLNCIVMNMMGKSMITPLSNLTKGERKIFQKRMNEYATDLPEDDWEDYIIKEFNEMVCNDLMNASFRPEQHPPHTINLTPQLLE